MRESRETERERERERGKEHPHRVCGGHLEELVKGDRRDARPAHASRDHGMVCMVCSQSPCSCEP